MGSVRPSVFWLGVSLNPAVNTLDLRGHLSASSGTGPVQVQATLNWWLFVLSSLDLFAQLLKTEPKPQASSSSERRPRPLQALI